MGHASLCLEGRGQALCVLWADWAQTGGLWELRDSQGAGRGHEAWTELSHRASVLRLLLVEMGGLQSGLDEPRVCAEVTSLAGASGAGGLVAGMQQSGAEHGWARGGGGAGTAESGSGPGEERLGGGMVTLPQEPLGKETACGIGAVLSGSLGRSLPHCPEPPRTGPQPLSQVTARLTRARGWGGGVGGWLSRPWPLQVLRELHQLH